MGPIEIALLILALLVVLVIFLVICKLLKKNFNLSLETDHNDHPNSLVILPDYDDIKQRICDMKRSLLEGRIPNYLIPNDCTLIIGVDARPGILAGYCVNLTERTLSYYIVKVGDSPWILQNPQDSSEFEMKNVMYALMVWGEILVEKRIRIYTDNFAITRQNHFDEKNHGRRAFEVLSHFRNCKGVEVLNINNMAVNKNENLEHFVKYIQPADDLSRWDISLALNFLMRYYRIDQENVQGTHFLDTNRRQNRPNAGAWYSAAPRYRQLLHDVNWKIDHFDCHTCDALSALRLHLRR